MGLRIRNIKENDPEVMSKALSSQGWDKPADLYHRYLKEQEQG